MNKVVMWIIGILIIIVSITAFLNKKNMTQNKIFNEMALFIVKNNGIVVDTLDFDALEKCGSENFEAVLKTNGNKPVTHNYTGIQIKNICTKLGIEVNTEKNFILTAKDGFSVVYSGEDIIKDKTIFLVFAKNGKRLKSGKDGGRGPYQAIVVNDQFSNRRCKFAIEMDVK